VLFALDMILYGVKTRKIDVVLTEMTEKNTNSGVEVNGILFHSLLGKRDTVVLLLGFLSGRALSSIFFCKA